jgi:UDP-glucuronate decarboxylase
MHPNDGRVVSNFVIQALRNEPITIYGEGTQTRCFCYVDDQIEAWIRFMNTRDDLTGPINLGNPQETTMLELAQTIIDLTSSRSRVVKKPLPSDDPKRRRPDITLAEKELGWRPQVPLKDGLAKTIAYFDSLLRSGAGPGSQTQNSALGDPPIGPG